MLQENIEMEFIEVLIFLLIGELQLILLLQELLCEQIIIIKKYLLILEKICLKASAKVGKTPSDIFNNILLGKAVFLDHGFELVPGFRVITIYAHLSHIEDSIKPGYQISAGELIGKSGNTGMRESTIGSRAGSHLHWELILQKDEEEIFLGRNMPNPELYHMLKRIFKKKIEIFKGAIMPH